MEHCGKIVSNSGGVSILQPLEVLQRIVEEAQSPGLSTILLAYFDGQVCTMILLFNNWVNFIILSLVSMWIMIIFFSILPARKLLMPCVEKFFMYSWSIVLVLFILCFIFYVSFLSDMQYEEMHI